MPKDQGPGMMRAQKTGINDGAVRMGPSGPEHTHSGYSGWHPVHQKHRGQGGGDKSVQLHQQAGLGKDGYGATAGLRSLLGATADGPPPGAEKLPEISDADPEGKESAAKEKWGKLGRVAGTLGLGALEVGAGLANQVMGGFRKLMHSVLSGNPLSVGSTMMSETLRGFSNVQDSLDGVYSKYGIIPGTDPKVMDGTIKGRAAKKEEDLKKAGYKGFTDQFDEIALEVARQRAVKEGRDPSKVTPADVTMDDWSPEEAKFAIGQMEDRMDQAVRTLSTREDLTKEDKAVLNAFIEAGANALQTSSAVSEEKKKRYKQLAAEGRANIAYDRSIEAAKRQDIKEKRQVARGIELHNATNPADQLTLGQLGLYNDAEDDVGNPLPPKTYKRRSGNGEEVSVGTTKNIRARQRKAMNQAINGELQLDPTQQDPRKIQSLRYAVKVLDEADAEEQRNLDTIRRNERANASSPAMFDYQQNVNAGKSDLYDQHGACIGSDRSRNVALQILSDLAEMEKQGNTNSPEYREQRAAASISNARYANDGLERWMLRRNQSDIDEVNAKRAQYGLPPLDQSERSKDMRELQTLYDQMARQQGPLSRDWTKDPSVITDNDWQDLYDKQAEIYYKWTGQNLNNFASPGNGTSPPGAPPGKGGAGGGTGGGGKGGSGTGTGGTGTGTGGAGTGTGGAGTGTGTPNPYIPPSYTNNGGSLGQNGQPKPQTGGGRKGGQTYTPPGRYTGNPPAGQSYFGGTLDLNDPNNIDVKKPTRGNRGMWNETMGYDANRYDTTNHFLYDAMNSVAHDPKYSDLLNPYGNKGYKNRYYDTVGIKDPDGRRFEQAQAMKQGLTQVAKQLEVAAKTDPEAKAHLDKVNMAINHLTTKMGLAEALAIAREMPDEYDAKAINSALMDFNRNYSISGKGYTEEDGRELRDIDDVVPEILNRVRRPKKEETSQEPPQEPQSLETPPETEEPTEAEETPTEEGTEEPEEEDYAERFKPAPTKRKAKSERAKIWGHGFIQPGQSTKVQEHLFNNGYANEMAGALDDMGIDIGQFVDSSRDEDERDAILKIVKDPSIFNFGENPAPEEASFLHDLSQAREQMGLPMDEWEKGYRAQPEPEPEPQPQPQTGGQINDELMERLVQALENRGNAPPKTDEGAGERKLRSGAAERVERQKEKEKEKEKETAETEEEGSLGDTTLSEVKRTDRLKEVPDTPMTPEDRKKWTMQYMADKGVTPDVNVRKWDLNSIDESIVGEPGSNTRKAYEQADRALSDVMASTIQSGDTDIEVASILRNPDLKRKAMTILSEDGKEGQEPMMFRVSKAYEKALESMADSSSAESGYYPTVRSALQSARFKQETRIDKARQGWDPSQDAAQTRKNLNSMFEEIRHEWESALASKKDSMSKEEYLEAYSNLRNTIRGVQNAINRGRYDNADNFRTTGINRPKGSKDGKVKGAEERMKNVFPTPDFLEEGGHNYQQTFDKWKAEDERLKEIREKTKEQKEGKSSEPKEIVDINPEEVANQTIDEKRESLKSQADAVIERREALNVESQKLMSILTSEFGINFPNNTQPNDVMADAQIMLDRKDEKTIAKLDAQDENGVSQRQKLSNGIDSIVEHTRRMEDSAKLYNDLKAELNAYDKANEAKEKPAEEPKEEPKEEVKEEEPPKKKKGRSKKTPEQKEAEMQAKIDAFKQRTGQTETPNATVTESPKEASKIPESMKDRGILDEVVNDEKSKGKPNEKTKRAYDRMSDIAPPGWDDPVNVKQDMNDYADEILEFMDELNIDITPIGDDIVPKDVLKNLRTQLKLRNNAKLDRKVEGRDITYREGLEELADFLDAFIKRYDELTSQRSKETVKEKPVTKKDRDRALKEVNDTGLAFIQGAKAAQDFLDSQGLNLGGTYADDPDKIITKLQEWVDSPLLLPVKGAVVMPYDMYPDDSGRTYEEWANETINALKDLGQKNFEARQRAEDIRKRLGKH